MFYGLFKLFNEHQELRVPYLTPLTPKYPSGDTLFRGLLINENIRPGFTKTKDLTKDTIENK